MVASRYRGAISLFRVVALGTVALSRTDPSGGMTAAVRSRVDPAGAPAPIQIALDDPRRTHEVRIVTDRAGDPIDVRRFEGRDLPERVIVELAERDDGRLGIGQ